LPKDPLSICFPFVGDRVGGSHISSVRLIEMLDRDRFKPIIVLHQSRGPLADFLSKRGLTFIAAPSADILEPGYVQSGRSRWRDAYCYFTRTLPALVHFIKVNAIDIVHTNDGRMHVNWGLAARVAGAKLVWHHRGDPSAWGVNLLAPVICHQMVAVSSYALPGRPILPIKHRSQVIRSPFELSAINLDRDSAKRALLNELNLPSETRLLGYFGAIVNRKRPVMFVEAVHAIAKARGEPPVAGLLFGNLSPNEPHVADAVTKRARELQIGDRIYLMGFRVPVEPCIAGVDILLVPATNEPFGRTLIEAMLLGTPVVATDHGGNPEAIDDGVTGFLVEAERPDAFVAPVRTLLSDSGRWQSVSDTARQRALNNFSDAASVAQLSALYERLFRPEKQRLPMGRRKSPRIAAAYSAIDRRQEKHKIGFGDINFLIIGAAKSATTWLQKALQTDPAVTMPNPELHYFSRYHDRGDAWYLHQFPQQKTMLIGEKSNSYLSADAAPQRMAKVLGHAKLVAQLRNPVDRAYSDYCMLFRRSEVNRNIYDYLDPRVASTQRFLRDGLYAMQIERYLDFYSADQLLIAIYEDMKRDPEGHLQKVREFLGLASEPRAGVAREKIKDKQTPMIIGPGRRWSKLLKPVVAPFRGTKAFQFVRCQLAKPVAYPPLPADLRKRLVDYYADDTARLATLLNIDLEQWLCGSSEAVRPQLTDSTITAPS